MNHAGVRCEGIQLAGDAVVETGTDRDQQITRLYGQVSGFGTMHPQHTEIDVTVWVHTAQSLQSSNCRDAGLFCQLAQCRNRLRQTNTAANVEHGLSGLRNQCTCLVNCLMRQRISFFNRNQMRRGFTLCNLNVFRDINQYRARTA